MLRFAAVLAVAALAAALGLSSGGRAAPARAHERVHPRPNVVFILTDDLSWNLIQFMPHVRQMQRDGETFTNYFVTDSLCCPSRASIFTGRYPHNHRVLTNTAPAGGFAAFRRRAQRRTFATAIQKAGYRTAMMGKYLNGYKPRAGYVPPGWSNWQVGGKAYSGFDYFLDVNGQSSRFGGSPRDYVTDVLSRRGRHFVTRAAKAKSPFFIEIATYAPHHPYTPAPRDRYAFAGLSAPRTAEFDAPTTDAPSWLRDRPALTPEQTTQLDVDFRKRAQSVLAIDDMVGRIRASLAARHLSRDTYLV
ncbi:MAG: sulfatase-like hydrolase/transferase, partial [Thermoleophilaceae bacterium]